MKAESIMTVLCMGEMRKAERKGGNLFGQADKQGLKVNLE